MPDATRQLIMTTTNELFLPSRVVFRVLEPEQLLARFRQLRCMSHDVARGRWTWEYDFEAKQVEFPPVYEQIPPERRPVVLASCYLVTPETLHVYVRSTLRLTKLLLFFEKHIPHTCATGEFFDEYNLLTVHDLRRPLPAPEDYFRDDTKIAFFDVDTLGSDAAGADLLLRQTRTHVEPLERHRLTMFYEDGETHFASAMRLRELLAMKQHRSGEPIRPYDVILEALQASDQSATSNPKPEAVDPQPPGAGPQPSVAGTGQSGNVPEIGFSFLHSDQASDRLVFELTAVDGRDERYRFEFGCCDNPTCDCRSLEVWLQPLQESKPTGKTIHLCLSLDKREVQPTNPEGMDDRRLARELATRITPDDWLTALHFYRSDKADFSEPADASNLTGPFPEEWLADPAALIQYQDVFPYARHLRFQSAGQHWIVFERYCSNPACACREVCLDMAPVEESGRPDGERLVTEKEVTGLRFDYDRKRLAVRKPGPPSSPPALKLFAALEAATPDLVARLRRRQGLLRELHARARRQPHPIVPSPATAPEKVGRNQSCPCGSGRKYKKCCGANPARSS